MAIELNIKNIILPLIPKNTMGKNRTLKEISHKLSELLDLINKDLFNLVENGIGHDITQHPVAEILNPLLMLFDSIWRLPSSEIKNILLQQVRFFHLVVNNRLHQLQNKTIELEFVRLFQTIIDAIGIVPVLNDNIPLPEIKFLPSDFSKTIEKWQNIIFKSPSRKSNEGQNVNFFTIRIHQNNKNIKISSVRY